MNNYAVIGNPIQHSKSPEIHCAFSLQENVEIDYQRILANEDNFTKTVNSFFAHGGLGLNVTVPFKVTAYQQCAQLNEYAKAAKAVNTLSINHNGEWVGANTDGIGLLRDLTDNLHINVNNKSVLILGAGGATRGILLPLLQQQTKNIVVANRTVSKALELADTFKNLGAIHGCGYEDIATQGYEIIINATSASLDGLLPPISPHTVNQDTVCYDLAYSNEPTAFLRWANKHGVKNTYDGIGMLIEQAAESYYIWRGFKPNTSEVIALLKGKN